MHRLSDLGATQITFGGGDPFIYRRFPDLLRYIREELPGVGLLHVDTNGIALREQDYGVVVSTVDLLGFPLDGPSDEQNTLMRPNRAGFSAVRMHLGNLYDLLAIKINTVVTSRNVGVLGELSDLLRGTPPAIWALYEFWAIGPAASINAPNFVVEHETYTNAVSAIRAEVDYCHVEVNLVTSRSDSYFFVTHTGRAYAVSDDDHKHYVDLGSVFEDAVLNRWSAIVREERNGQRMSERLRIIRARP
ncbi:radical SAM protein [Actinophytocola sediminis]